MITNSFSNMHAVYLYAHYRVNAMYWKRQAMVRKGAKFSVAFNRQIWYMDQTLPIILKMTNGQVTRIRQEIDDYIKTHDDMDALNYYEFKTIDWRTPITCTDAVNADIIGTHWQGII